MSPLSEKDIEELIETSMKSLPLPSAAQMIRILVSDPMPLLIAQFIKEHYTATEIIDGLDETVRAIKKFLLE